MDFQRRIGTNSRTPALTSDISAQDVQNLCGQLKSKFEETIQSIEDSSSSTTKPKRWDNTFASLSLALGEASEISALITLPSMTHKDSKVRQASTKSKDELKSMFDSTFGRPQLYQTLKGLPKQEIENQTSTDQHFHKLMMNAFHRNGCDLNDDQRIELLEKRQQIEEICSAFSFAINENNDCLYFSDEELDGITNLDQFPIVMEEGQKEDSKNKIGKRKVVLKAPFTVPVLQFAKSPKTRQAVAMAMAKKCQAENTNRFLQTLMLRHETAELLGYKSHAHYMLEPKMASTPENAESFLLDLIEQLKSKRDEDLQILSNFKQEDDDDDDDNHIIQPWDVNYYIRTYKATLGVDEAKLQEYFPLDHVKNEILKIYEELLHLKFIKVEDAEIWHEDVECYAVMPASEGNEDKDDDGDALGYFYFDIYPREGKYSHQCVYPLRPSYTLPTTGERIKPACVNIGNLSRGKDGQPSMLRFREVETFFHEFGHVVHCVLGQSNHSLQSWAWSAVPWPGGVEQDFLEVPSMMLENFVWQPEILKRLSKRPSDDASLPEEMIDALCKSRMVMEGYSRCRYLAMALYDLKVHSGRGPYEYLGKSYDAIELFDVMMKDISGVSNIPGTFQVASWFHPMMGYDAGYYSYIWSEAFASDLFSEFENHGTSNNKIIDPILGEKYRETILSPCAMLDGDSMLKNFLGRKASNHAFLKRVLED